ncbi:MAG: tryptophan synthase subunit alpha [Desulfobacterales bacterium]|nr:tryptophan synthase subunit alpha [Desulfobacterales bacterium]
MNRIATTFERLRRSGDKALVGFVTAGDPDPERSLAIVRAMCAAGLDVLELGVPFSDPTADGPVIQRASARALAAGANLRRTLAMVAALRRESGIPTIVFSYYNPILSYGAETCHRDALAAGADGLLLVDLPPEESDELTAGWPPEGLALIRLTTPTTPIERMRRIAAAASGFIYHVSKLGVTGSDGLQVDTVAAKVGELRTVTPLPVCAGFGISTPADVAAVAAVCDGVVVGSAFERLIEANLDRPELPQMVAARVAELKAATRTSAG